MDYTYLEAINYLISQVGAAPSIQPTITCLMCRTPSSV